MREVNIFVADLSVAEVSVRGVGFDEVLICCLLICGLLSAFNNNFCRTSCSIVGLRFMVYNS